MNKNKTIAVLQQLIRASLYALIFFLPISIALVGVFAGFTISFFVIKRIVVFTNSGKKKNLMLWEVLKPVPTALNWALLSFVGAVFLSVIFSQDFSLSLWAFLGKLLRGVYLYAAFVEAFDDEVTINRFILVWICSSFAVAAAGLHQFIMGVDFIRHTALSGGRVSSSLRHANDYGAYLITVYPMAMVILLNWKKQFFGPEYKKDRSRGIFLMIFFVLAIVLLTINLGLTFSRSSWLGIFLGLMLLGFYDRRYLPHLIIFVVAFYVIFLPMMVKSRNVSFLSDSVATETASQKVNKLLQLVALRGNGRSGFWEEAIRIFSDYPVWGSGLNTYSQMGTKYKITWGGYPHNSYLQMLAETGILGLGSFLWLMTVLFVSSLKRLRQVSKGFGRLALMAALAGLMAYLIQSFFDTTFYSVQLSVLMWLLIGLIMAMCRVNSTLTKPRA